MKWITLRTDVKNRFATVFGDIFAAVKDKMTPLLGPV